MYVHVQNVLQVIVAYSQIYLSWLTGLRLLIEGNVITLRPSLIISKAECDFVVDTIRRAIINELAK